MMDPISKFNQKNNVKQKQDLFFLSLSDYLPSKDTVQNLNHINRENKSPGSKAAGIFSHLQFKKKIINTVNSVGGFFENYLRVHQLEQYKEISLQALGKDPGCANYKTFIGLKFILTAFFIFSAFLFMKSFYLCVIVAIAAGIGGFFVPDILFKKLAADRSEEFNRDLPYIIDLLYISAMSGQNIYNCLKILVENYKSKASSEIAVFLKEINSGVGRHEAFNNVIARNNIENFRNLLFLILQAEKYGSSINEIFRQKSKYLRFEISQKIETRARKTSIFLLFPLVFLILPAFVLLVGGPLVFTLSRSLLFY